MSDSGVVADADMLSGASETLFIPLAGRARGSKERIYKGFQDPESEALAERLNLDLERYAADRATMAGVIHRGAFFDSRCLDFLNRHPDGVVLTVGAGLNTAYERVARQAPEGSWRWIDTDLDPVMKVRTQLFQDDGRRTSMVLDASDMNALDAVLTSITAPVLIVSEAVLIYVRPEDVEAVFRRLANQKNAECVFDWVSPSMMRNSRNHPAMKRLKDQSVVFASSMKRAQDIQSYDPRWKIIAESSAPMTRSGFMPALAALVFSLFTFGRRFYGCAHARLI